MTPEQRAAEVLAGWPTERGWGYDYLRKAITEAIRAAVDEKTAALPTRPFTEELWKLYWTAAGVSRSIDPDISIRAALVAVERRVRDKCCEEIGMVAHQIDDAPIGHAALRQARTIIQANKP